MEEEDEKTNEKSFMLFVMLTLAPQQFESWEAE